MWTLPAVTSGGGFRLGFHGGRVVGGGRDFGNGIVGVGTSSAERTSRRRRNAFFESLGGLGTAA